MIYNRNFNIALSELATMMKTRLVVLLAILITGRFTGEEATARGVRGRIALNIVPDAFRGRRDEKAPDGTSEGTVSRFTSGRLPNGYTSRSGRSAS